MDAGGLRRGLGRRGRGAGGPPRPVQAAAAGGGARNGGRAGNPGRGGGRAGNDGRGGARGGNAGRGGQLQVPRRAWPPAPPRLRPLYDGESKADLDVSKAGAHGEIGAFTRPVHRADTVPRPQIAKLGHLQDWLANSKFLDLNGLSYEEFESELDQYLENKQRIDYKELEVYTAGWDHQGDEAAHLVMEADYKFRRMAFTRKLLLRMYHKGQYISPGAQHWRKNLKQQEKDLQDLIFELEKSKIRHRPVPEVFLLPPTLLPKEKQH